MKLRLRNAASGAAAPASAAPASAAPAADAPPPKPAPHPYEARLGKAAFRHYCQTCHGETGAGVGLSALMPPWGHTLSPRQIDELVRYLRMLPRKPAS